MDSSPNTPFEALFGVPAPGADAVATPMEMDAVGKICDFCGPALGSDDPAVWAYPCGQTSQQFDIGGTGRTMDIPLAAGLWYACARCHRYIKGNGWAALAKSIGFADGHAGPPAWQSFRVAREKGPGYRWPLDPNAVPALRPTIRTAWAYLSTAAVQPDHRETVAKIKLIAELCGTLYATVPTEDDVKFLREYVGPYLVPSLQIHLGRSLKFALYAAP
ncbi:hypothetical protein AB0A05_27050 [Streptomyces sp. NPDC046374]|uniref:hypothetical protein n=1 Tax=Streptomyces sp. NPDC046374 TaxID=3154917 RepID=UPI0033C1B31E